MLILLSVKKGKVLIKVFPYTLPSVGPGADRGVQQPAGDFKPSTQQ